MKIKIQNILSVKQAELFINGLTVIGGLNDSGKSTIGKAVFCLIKSAAMINSDFFRRSRSAFIASKISDIKTIIKVLVESKEQYDMIASRINEFEKKLIKVRKKACDTLINSMKTEIDNFFKKNNVNMPNKAILEGVFLELQGICNNSYKEKFKKDLSSKVIRYMFDGDPIYHGASFGIISIEDEKIKKTNEIIINNDGDVKTLSDENGKVLFDVTYIDTPVILQLYSILKDPEVYSREYSPTVKDLIRKLLSEPKESLFSNFKSEIISEIKRVVNLNKVKIESGDFYFSRGGEYYKANNLATGIKSFVLLWLLLDKGFIAKNTLLVLDEPEVHLHPYWQLEYAKLIVKLVKNDVKVLVASHSPYMIEALYLYSNLEKIHTDFYLAEDGRFSKQDSLENIFLKLAEPMRELKKIELSWG